MSTESRAAHETHVRPVPFRLAALLCALASVLASSAPADSVSRAAPLDQELALSLVEEISAEVADVRGLEFRREVPVAVVDDDAARDHFLARLHSFQTPEQLADVGRAYQLLGLLPPGFDVLDAFLGALREQAGGYYDPERASYYLLGDMPPALAPAITAHELTHALEDQHFDLDGRLREALLDDDLMFAMGAVHEGSAMLVMTLVVSRKLLGGEMALDDVKEVARTETAKAEALLELPPVLLRQMIGPYMLGPGFLTEGKFIALASEGYPVERMKRVYASGPTSSEQILHPEKYWDAEQRDDPQPVSLNGVGGRLGSRWTRAMDGVLGEVGLAPLVGAPTPLFLDALTPLSGGQWTNEAASGWGGDHWELWRNGDSEVVLLATIWDDEEDARQFADALSVNEGLRSRRAGRRVAVVAGDLGRRKADRLLEGMLQPAEPVE